MKRILFLLFCVSFIGLSGQSLQVMYGDTVATGNATNSKDIPSHIYVKNISKVNVNVKVKRIDTGYVALTDSNAMCWQPVCFQASVSESPFALVLEPDSLTTGFNGYVYPDKDGIPASGPITYVFFNEFDTTDRVTFTVLYEVTADFSLEEKTKKFGLSVYPNPADNYTEVSYTIENPGESTFELVNVVGNRVFQKTLAERNGTFELNISKLPKGVYFYVLKENGKTLEAKKLMVK